LKLRFAAPGHLIDVSRISGLAGITDGGSTITIGATTRHADVVSSPIVKAKVPVLSEAASHIGDPAVRNMGTIGGSLAHADPGADLPAVMLAVGAAVTLTSASGQRTVAADDFFIDVFQTAMKPNEMLTAVSIPVQSAGMGGAYEKHADPASGYALVGIAAVVTVAGGKVTAARVAMTGLGPKAVRLTAVESSLTSGATVDAAAAKASEGMSFHDDAGGSAAYKANLATVFTRRALARAMARAGG
ncbi:MAG: FAD binding domain-containing protein, partial [Cytophagaceae bacterium]|nr:FAD binding domain-containing protein [Gemmatimonadaceae bacterium]